MKKYLQIFRESCDAVLAWHEIQYSSSLLNKMKNCKVIVRVGVGYDNVLLQSASENNIIVCNVPDYGTDDVADHTMALMLSLCRGIENYNKAARNNIWEWETGSELKRIKGLNLGIIGLGRIGTAVALRAKSFGMNIRFYDPYKPFGYEKTFSFERELTLNSLAVNSDIITIHTPLTPETKGMINKLFFDNCKEDTILINTARGPIVNLDDLYNAMLDGKIRKTGMDVLPKEPPQRDHPLIQKWIDNKDWNERIIITPHSAFYNQDSYAEMRRKAAEEALRVLRNEKPLNQVLM